MKKLVLVLFLSVIVSFTIFANGEGESGGSVTIGVTIETFDDVFMTAVKDEIEATAQTMGVKIIATDAKSDPAEQVKQIDNFITAQVDGIIIHVINNDIAPTITNKAIEAGIPLVYLNRRPNADGAVPEGQMVAVVASPEIEAGRGQAKYVVEKLGTSGNAVILLGGLGSAPQVGRTQGVEEYLSQNAPGFNIIREQTANWKRPEAIQVMENWLASGDKIDAVFANNDEMAIGAALALKERGLKDSVIVVGVDASPDGIAALEAGDMDMTMFQNGRAQGKGSLEVALKMINGDSFNQSISIPFEPVTKDNAIQYK